jgi:hypothetical protein
MRYLCLAGLVLGLFLQSGQTHAQSDQSGAVYFAGGDKSVYERTVTVSKNGTAITSFKLPSGTFLSAVDQTRKTVPLPGGRFEFHGSVELRVLPAADGPHGSMSAADIMSRAPLVLNGEGVDVVIEQTLKH